MSEDYIRILRESLEKKASVLKKITILNERQRHYFERSDTMPDELEANIEAKGALVDQIVALDDGFEQVYARVQEVLSERREDYKDEIRAMQDLIREVTELSSKVEAQEQRNRDLAAKFYGEKKAQTRQVRKGTAAVNRYYQGTMRAGAINPQFMDTKQ
ncbi:MAG: flagellar protein FliT [Lachnospiraceae bacterium]|nr:flagellar protein FliT [Lachnospiraceae bacterium]